MKTVLGRGSAVFASLVLIFLVLGCDGSNSPSDSDKAGHWDSLTWDEGEWQ